MKLAIGCLFVSILMLSSSLVAATYSPLRSETSPATLSEARYNQAGTVIHDLQQQLEKTTTRQEAATLVNKAIVRLHDQGVMPIGMSVPQAQRIVKICLLLSESLSSGCQPTGNNTGNKNCLVIGYMNESFFRWNHTIMNIPFLVNLTNKYKLMNLIYLPLLIRDMEPIKLGPFMEVGSHFKDWENGQLANERIATPTGWVWSSGANGIQKWNGSFYGGLYTIYTNATYNQSFAELWQPIGIQGFFGIDFFNAICNFGGYHHHTLTIGFATEVNMTYTAPWP